MNSRRWAALLAALLALLLAVWFLPRRRGTQAAVYQNGALVQVLDLTKPQRLTVTGPAGENVIVAENGTVFVESADCPDQVCVRHGPLGAGGPIVCLPNRLVIEFVRAPEGPDAVSGRAG